MKTMKSQKYKYWKSIPDFKRCFFCLGLHGKIYLMNEQPIPPPPLHKNCRCEIEVLDCLYAGTATNKGFEGADVWLSTYGVLPDYYITKKEAIKLGYIPALGNLWAVAPGKMLAKGEYKNKNGHLPSKEGRIWYEADINYVYLFRGNDRILYSNDGLIFVTFDHYRTFIEIKELNIYE